MMDIVWMRLTQITKNDGVLKEEETYYMFGPTGVIHFNADEEGNTQLRFSSGKTEVVKESQDRIFDLIATIRGTNVKSKRKATRSKKKA